MISVLMETTAQRRKQQEIKGNNQTVVQKQQDRLWVVKEGCVVGTVVLPSPSKKDFVPASTVGSRPSAAEPPPQVTSSPAGRGTPTEV